MTAQNGDNDATMIESAYRDLLAAVDRYLENTQHLFHGEMPRSCYEYDDDPLAWEAMSSARASLRRHFLAGVKAENLKKGF